MIKKKAISDSASVCFYFSSTIIRQKKHTQQIWYMRRIITPSLFICIKKRQKKMYWLRSTPPLVEWMYSFNSDVLLSGQIFFVLSLYIQIMIICLWGIYTENFDIFYPLSLNNGFLLDKPVLFVAFSNVI
jgi:hypothetical protein